MHFPEDPTTRPPSTAVILHGHTSSGLTVTRSLGRRGIRVLVCNDVTPSLSAASRYCHEVVHVPGFADRPDEVAAQLERRLRTLDRSIVIAPTDEALMFIHRFREIFAGHVCAVPDAEVADWALDKAKTVRLAERLGLPVPRTWFPEDYPDAGALADDVVFPCIVKSRRSCYWGPDGRLVSKRGTVTVCHSKDDVRASLRDATGPPPILQEFVEGEGRGVYLLTQHGSPRMEFAHRRLREGDPRGGGASFAESVAVDPELSAIGRRLLGEIGWHGVAMVEFKAGRRPWIMEINGRFWNSLPLSLRAGLDFPWQLFRMYSGQEVPVQGDYRIGTRCRYLKGDLAYLRTVFRGRPPDWPGRYPTRLSAVLGVLRAFLPDVGSYTLALDDPLPGLAELWVALRARPVR